MSLVRIETTGWAKAQRASVVVLNAFTGNSDIFSGQDTYGWPDVPPVWAPSQQRDALSLNASVFLTLPSFIGQSSITAILQLFQLGLNSVVDGPGGVGIVATQSPAAGTIVYLGTTVHLTLVQPPPAGYIAMPNVVGVTFYQALEVLQAAGIYLPAVAFNFGPSSIAVNLVKTTAVRVGFVSAQSIAAGTYVRPGANIVLTVSTSPFGMIIDLPPDWRQHL
jgi:hypothetical protein